MEILAFILQILKYAEKHKTQGENFFLIKIKFAL